MSVGQAEGYVRVCASEELGLGASVGAMIGDQPICVVRVEEGVFAFDDVCPHRGAKLSEGKLAGTTLTCAKHTWEFDVRSGDLLRMRAPVCLTMRPVQEQDGEIQVSVA